MIKPKELKEIRTKNHITQEALAIHSKVSKLTLRRFEKGLTENPKPEILEAIERGLNELLNNHKEAKNIVFAVIEYMVEAEAEIPIEETIIDSENYITQRRYGKPIIKKVIKNTPERYKVRRIINDSISQIFPSYTK